MTVQVRVALTRAEFARSIVLWARERAQVTDFADGFVHPPPSEQSVYQLTRRIERATIASKSGPV